MSSLKPTGKVKGILIAVLQWMFIPCAVLIAMFIVLMTILDWMISGVVNSVKNWM